MLVTSLRASREPRFIKPSLQLVTVQYICIRSPSYFKVIAVAARDKEWEWFKAEMWQNKDVKFGNVNWLCLGLDLCY